MDIKAILKDIRNKEASLLIKDGAPPISSDGSKPSSVSRQTTHDKKDQSPASLKDKKWHIPWFPKSWETTLGKGIYNLHYAET